MNKMLLAVSLIACASTARASDPVGTPVRGEIITGWQQADGSRVSAVRLTLAPGWKTYWRAPGDAGIPPDFSWTGSDNLAGVTVSWPTPKVFDQNGMRSIGYGTQVILPLSIAPRQPGAPVTLKLRMDIGVCSDICVPETLHLDATLETGSAKIVPAIAAALAERPLTAREAGAGPVTCTLSPTQDGLAVTARLTLPHTGGDEHVVIETGRRDVWVSEAQTIRSGNVLTARAEMVPGATVPLAIDRSKMRFTVLGASHAVDLQGCNPG